jgi:small GTP-binding protein
MTGKSVKVVILGDASIGKTSLIQRYISGKNDIQNSTLGAVFVQLYHSFKDENNNFIEFPIQCWDTAGQERYQALIPMYVRDADFIIIAFDLNNVISFMDLKKWVVLSKESIRNCKYVLVGCKNDLKPHIEIKKDDIKKFIVENIPGSEYFSTSSLTGNNINELFLHIKKELEDLGRKRHILNKGKQKTIIISEDTGKNSYPDLRERLNKCCF